MVRLGFPALASLASLHQVACQDATPATPALRGSAITAEEPCQTALPGSGCYDSVRWAMDYGLEHYPTWYPGITKDSTFEDYQELFYRGGHGPFLSEAPRFRGCGRPCRGDGGDGGEASSTSGAPTADLSWGWRHTSEFVGPDGTWCRVEAPAEDFSLKKCNVTGPRMPVKVLTWNLFWWNLFKQRGGGDAGTLLRVNELPAPYDFMGFQECDDVERVLEMGGLLPEFGHLQGDHALGLAYRQSAWELISSETTNVAEDGAAQWYGVRGALWGRFRHKSEDKTVFFVTHHGPLPVNSGGRCGWDATAYNLLRLIATKAEPRDALVLVGDFNADLNTGTVKNLESRMYRVYTGTAFGGIDHIFSNCGGGAVASTRDLGSGGSDHDALEVVIGV